MKIPTPLLPLHTPPPSPAPRRSVLALTCGVPTDGWHVSVDVTASASSWSGVHRLFWVWKIYIKETTQCVVRWLPHFFVSRRSLSLTFSSFCFLPVLLILSVSNVCHLLLSLLVTISLLPLGSFVSHVSSALFSSQSSQSSQSSLASVTLPPISQSALFSAHRSQPPLSFLVFLSTRLLHAPRSPFSSSQTAKHSEQTRAKLLPRYCSGTRSSEQDAQTTLPQARQWCRRRTTVNSVVHSMHMLTSLLGIYRW